MSLLAGDHGLGREDALHHDLVGAPVPDPSDGHAEQRAQPREVLTLEGNPVLEEEIPYYRRKSLTGPYCRRKSLTI